VEEAIALAHLKPVFSNVPFLKLRPPIVTSSSRGICKFVVGLPPSRAIAFVIDTGLIGPSSAPTTSV
jgi:hypothetical protein